MEAALGEHPGIASSVVIGLPDSDLARYKIPRGFTFSGQPLRDDAGQVRRCAVPALLADSRLFGQ